ncbi:MAG: hypothetical protein HY321_12485 [Armatimonadetes bacterium]|nr:hypothetical protein [Armatimonadota bacterium]
MQQHFPSPLVPIFAALLALAALWPAQPADAPAALLTRTPDASESEPLFLSERRIAYLRAPKGRAGLQWSRELWLMDEDGRRNRRVLGEGCFHLRPSASGRQRLACSRYSDVRAVVHAGRTEGWEARTAIWAFSLPDARPQRVAGPGAVFLDGWTQDDRIAFHEGLLGYDDVQGFHEATGFPPPRAWLAPFGRAAGASRLDPSRQPRFADRGLDREQLATVGVWAPDGSGCIRARWYERDGRPRIGYDFIQPGRPPRRVLETEEHLTYSEEPWTPAVVWADKRRVLLGRFVSRPDPRLPQSRGRFYLVLVHPGSGAFRVLAPEVPMAPSPDPVVSPGDWRVLFRGCEPDGSPGLWVVTVDGPYCRRILAGEASYTPWAWSLDGRSLVISRPEEGGCDLWRIDL